MDVDVLCIVVGIVIVIVIFCIILSKCFCVQVLCIFTIHHWMCLFQVGIQIQEFVEVQENLK